MDSGKKTNILWGKAAKVAGMPALAILLALVFSPASHAQTFNNAGNCQVSGVPTNTAPGCLGDFQNPPTVKDSAGTTCNYDLLEIDLSQGKVFARPYRNASNGGCNTALVEITTLASPGTAPSTTTPPFSTPPTGAINDGVIQVRNFTFQLPSLSGASLHTLCAQAGGCSFNVALEFLPNANNTPVMLIATGNVTMNAATWVQLFGLQPGNSSGIFPGLGGLGGPGGFQGGAGGEGGSSTSAGAAGSGPGGGLGGAANPTNYQNTTASSATVYLTTGQSLPQNNNPTTVPAGNDLALMLRGGSGGGGGGGGTSYGGNGGGGGGGAILITANGTITLNGNIDAEGGTSGLGGSNYAGGGGGGMIRLVAPTIAGSGYLDTSDLAQGGSGGPNGGYGVVRFESYTNTFNAVLNSTVWGVSVTAANAPGQIVLPAAALVTLQFASVADNNPNNPTNIATVASAPQATPGRTGTASFPDFVMPTTASNVTVTLNAGPPSANSALLNKVVTLVVTPLDAAQGTPAGSSATYTQAITCSTTCTATFPSVTLPLGAGSMSAFVEVSLTSSGTLARLFPPVYQGEAIEAVRLETSGTDTKYVLVAKSGKLFPYQPRK